MGREESRAGLAGRADRGVCRGWPPAPNFPPALDVGDGAVTLEATVRKSFACADD